MGVLKDGYFTTLKPADIISAVGTITLAVISSWLNDELARVGWYLRNNKGEIYPNPTIDKLYYLNVGSGLWVARSATDATFNNTTLSTLKGYNVDSGSKSVAENAKEINASLTAQGAIFADVYDAGNHCLKVNDVVP